MSVFSNSLKTSFQRVVGPCHNYVAEKKKKCVCPSAELLKVTGFSILPIGITAVSSEDDCAAAAAFASVLPCCRPV